MPLAFVPFGFSHLSVIALAIAVPVALAFATGRPGAAQTRKIVCRSFAALLLVSWAAWYALFFARGWLTPGNVLPMNLCDWAMIAVIVTLIRPNQTSYELAYFWAFGGTLQALITPDVTYEFPDAQFVVFFLGHAAIIAAVLYLTLGLRMRPVPKSILRVIGWSLAYLAAAGATDWLLDTNYGFLRAKPHQATLYDALAPWPYYIPETVLIGIASALILYAPFLILDLVRGPKSREAAGTIVP